MTTIQFADGTTTIDLTGGTGDYALMYNSWSPKIAKRRQSVMGGQSPYEDVREEMAIIVKGTSETDCLGNLQTLTELFDQANAWRLDDSTNTAVEIQIQPKGSSATVDAVIWDCEITAPADMTWLGATSEYRLQPVILRFTRRGLWLGSTETESSSTSTGNPAILTSSTFTNSMDVLVPSDIYIDFDSSGAAQPDGDSDIWIIATNAANKLQIEEAEGGTLSNVTSTVVSGSSAGSVARWSPRM